MNYFKNKVIPDNIFSEILTYFNSEEEILKIFPQNLHNYLKHLLEIPHIKKQFCLRGKCTNNPNHIANFSFPTYRNIEQVFDHFVPTIHTLIINDININDSSIARLCQMMRQLPNLYHLELIAINADGDSDWMEILLEYLKENNQLIKLDLSMNDMGRYMTQRFAFEYLKTTRSLQELSLVNAWIDMRRWYEIADALETNQSIEHLDISGNEINNDIGIYLMEILSKNNTLKYINFEDNCIGKKCGKNIKQVLNKKYPHITVDF
jgi:hypothetical protein